MNEHFEKITTGLTHDETLRAASLELAILLVSNRGDHIDSDVVLNIARKFEAFMREKIQ